MKVTALIASSLFALAAAIPAAAAHEVEYATTLSGLAEIPPNASSGTGTAVLTVDFDTLMMEVNVSFAGLSGTTTAAHIHCCTATPGSGNVGVATVLPTFTDFPLGVTSGTYDHTFDMALASSYNPDFVTAHSNVSGAFSALIAGMESGNAYLNIHTTFAPGGEIRGLLHAVPEPEVYALLVAGLAALGWTKRRRRVEV